MQRQTFADFRDGHYFHYIPAGVVRTKPTPALVFLHGSGGNFKACHSRIRPAQLATRLQPRRVLILSGGSDDRVPWEYVSGYAEKLKAGGLDVTSHRFEGEDHFLFFHQRAEELKLITSWIAADSMAQIPAPR